MALVTWVGIKTKENLLSTKRFVSTSPSQAVFLNVIAKSKIQSNGSPETQHIG